jgi:hypothetical protein
MRTSRGVCVDQLRRGLAPQITDSRIRRSTSYSSKASRCQGEMAYCSDAARVPSRKKELIWLMRWYSIQVRIRLYGPGSKPTAAGSWGAAALPDIRLPWKLARCLEPERLWTHLFD